MKELLIAPVFIVMFLGFATQLVDIAESSSAKTLDYAEEALNISRYDSRIIEIAGEALFYLGRWKEALKYFEEYTAINPTGGRVEDVYYFMGELFIQLGKYNNADIALSTALYHSPNVASWWARLGYTREKAGDYRPG